mgnify:FL=1
MSDILLNFIFLSFGILIGINLRNTYAQNKERKTFNEVDEQVRNELAVAKNLNKSLLDDVRFLREKLQRLKN